MHEAQVAREFDPEPRILPLADYDRRGAEDCDGASAFENDCPNKAVAVVSIAVRGRSGRYERLYCKAHGEAFARSHGLEVTL